MKNIRDLKIGILGGGQLGRMLAQAGIPLNAQLSILDPDSNAPAATYCKFHQVGSFRDHREVLEFAKTQDLLTVEIEEVSVEALEEIEAAGTPVYPQPSILQIIRDKGLQKQFYQDHQIPTMPFAMFQSASKVLTAIETAEIKLPFVQKSRRAGYDGQGVRVIKDRNDLDSLLDSPCIIEELCDMKMEISVIVARSISGECKTYDPVEMVFNPKANLIDTLAYPARISKELTQEATQLAKKVAESFGIVGLLAVEMFLTQEGKLVINECAPRPHNSGHQTIESCSTSQYEQHLRAISGLPLGDTQIKVPSAMVNLIGEESFSGPAIFSGLEEALALSGVKLHDYGKAETRPFRKMGHVTIIDPDIETALKRANQVKSLIKVIS